MSNYMPLTRSPSHGAGLVAIRRRRSSGHYYEEPEFDSEFATRQRQDSRHHRAGSSYSQSVYAPEEQTQLANGYVGRYGSPPETHRRRAFSHSYHPLDQGPPDGIGYAASMGPGHYGPQVAAPGSLPAGQPMFNNGPVMGHPHMGGAQWGAGGMAGSGMAGGMGSMAGGMGGMAGMGAMGGLNAGMGGVNAMGVPYPNSMPLGGMTGGAPLPGVSDYGRPKWAHFVKPGEAQTYRAYHQITDARASSTAVQTSLMPVFQVDRSRACQPSSALRCLQGCDCVYGLLFSERPAGAADASHLNFTCFAIDVRRRPVFEFL